MSGFADQFEDIDSDQKPISSFTLGDFSNAEIAMFISPKFINEMTGKTVENFTKGCAIDLFNKYTRYHELQKSKPGPAGQATASLESAASTLTPAGQAAIARQAAAPAKTDAPGQASVTPKKAAASQAAGPPKAAAADKAAGPPKAPAADKAAGPPKAAAADKAAGPPKAPAAGQAAGPPKAAAADKAAAALKAAVDSRKLMESIPTVEREAAEAQSHALAHAAARAAAVRKAAEAEAAALKAAAAVAADEGCDDDDDDMEGGDDARPDGKAADALPGAKAAAADPQSAKADVPLGQGALQLTEGDINQLERFIQMSRDDKWQFLKRYGSDYVATANKAFKELLQVPLERNVCHLFKQFTEGYAERQATIDKLNKDDVDTKKQLDDVIQKETTAMRDGKEDEEELHRAQRKTLRTKLTDLQADIAAANADMGHLKVHFKTAQDMYIQQSTEISDACAAYTASQQKAAMEKEQQPKKDKLVFILHNDANPEYGKELWEKVHINKPAMEERVGITTALSYQLRDLLQTPLLMAALPPAVFTQFDEASKQLHKCCQEFPLNAAELEKQAWVSWDKMNHDQQKRVLRKQTPDLVGFINSLDDKPINPQNTNLVFKFSPATPEPRAAGPDAAEPRAAGPAAGSKRKAPSPSREPVRAAQGAPTPRKKVSGPTKKQAAAADMDEDEDAPSRSDSGSEQSDDDEQGDDNEQDDAIQQGDGTENVGAFRRTASGGSNCSRSSSRQATNRLNLSKLVFPDGKKYTMRKLLQVPYRTAEIARQTCMGNSQDRFKMHVFNKDLVHQGEFTGGKNKTVRLLCAIENQNNYYFLYRLTPSK